MTEISAFVYPSSSMQAIYTLFIFGYIVLLHGIFGTIQRRGAVDEFRSYDVTIPRIYNKNKTINTTVFEDIVLPHDIYVEFSAFQQQFLLQLVLNKYLFTSNYTEKSIKGNEDIYHAVESSKQNCYYSGHVIGHPLSTAAVSTCSGLRGYVTMDDDGYHIEPWQPLPSSSGKHYVFRDSDYSGPNIFCGEYKRTLKGHRIWRALNDMTTKVMTFNGHDDDDARNDSKKLNFIELYVVNDFSQFSALRNNASKVFARTKDIINIVNSFYRPLNIIVMLVGVEVWIRGDRIEISSNVDKTLNNFLEYRQKNINPKRFNDNAQFLTHRYLGDGIMGKSPIMTICTGQSSGGVNLDDSSVVGPTAMVVSHGIGHNLGLFDDREGTGYIMDPNRSKQKMNGMKWSESSKQQLIDSFHQRMDYCLQNAPETFYDGSVCGDGFTEGKEECDCGLPQDCRNFCCDASTCKLMSNASCAVGECCDSLKCQLKPSSTECRSSRNDCDLSEYCNGINEFCPADIFRSDGTQCYNNQVKSYCYEGKCNTHDGQCQVLWGNSGRVAHHLCFDRFNALGNYSGHCGIGWNNGKTFKRCLSSDTLCGMLFCQHLNEKLMFWRETLTSYLQESYVTIDNTRQECKGVIFDVNYDLSDPGMVQDGARCGDGKMCVDQKCEDVESILAMKECPDCHGRGVCNSVGQCHCDIGYGPPFCDRLGNGGSEHSGPIVNYSSKTNVGLIVGLCLFFLLVLPFLFLVVFCGFLHRQKFKHVWMSRQTTDKYRSVDQSNESTLAFSSPVEAVGDTNGNSVTVEDRTSNSAPLPPPPPPPPLPPSSAPTVPPSAHSSVLPMRPRSEFFPSSLPPSSRSAHPKRASSITHHDISSPKFVSSTNVHLDSTLPLPRMRKVMTEGHRHDDDTKGALASQDELEIRTLPNPHRKSHVANVSRESSERNVKHRSVAAAGALPPPCLLKEMKEDEEEDENVYEEIAPPPLPPPPQSKRLTGKRGDRKKPSQETRTTTGLQKHVDELTSCLSNHSDVGVVTGPGKTNKLKPKTSVGSGDKPKAPKRQKRLAAVGRNISDASSHRNPPPPPPIQKL